MFFQYKNKAGSHKKPQNLIKTPVLLGYPLKIKLYTSHFKHTYLRWFLFYKQNACCFCQKFYPRAEKMFFDIFFIKTGMTPQKLLNLRSMNFTYYMYLYIHLICQITFLILKIHPQKCSDAWTCFGPIVPYQKYVLTEEKY